MDFIEVFTNKWHEFSGGSRPETFKIGFFEEGDGYRLHLNYIFDWNDSQRTDISFHLSKEEYYKLVQDLEQKGSAKLDKEEGKEDVHFEWKVVEGILRFKLQGRGSSPVEGYPQFYMDDFKDIISDEVNRFFN